MVVHPCKPRRNSGSTPGKLTILKNIMVNKYFAAEIFVNENSVLYKEGNNIDELTKWIKNKAKHEFFVKEFKTTIVVMKFILNEKNETKGFKILNHFVREKGETRYREKFYDNGKFELTKKYWLNVWE